MNITSFSSRITVNSCHEGLPITMFSNYQEISLTSKRNNSGKNRQKENRYMKKITTFIDNAH